MFECNFVVAELFTVNGVLKFLDHFTPSKAWVSGGAGMMLAAGDPIAAVFRPRLVTVVLLRGASCHLELEWQ